MRLMPIGSRYITAVKIKTKIGEVNNPAAASATDMIGKEPKYKNILAVCNNVRPITGRQFTGIKEAPVRSAKGTISNIEEKPRAA